MDLEKEIESLKEALEYQVDVVLRLEEERLLLLKENTIQKEKISQQRDMLDKYLTFAQVDNCMQTDTIACQEEGVQADMEEELETSSYSLSNSQAVSNSQSQISLNLTEMQKSLQTDIVTEAKTLIQTSKKDTPKQRSKLPVRNLKFCGDNYKENSKANEGVPKKNEKDVQLESMAQEILKLNKLVGSLKLNQRALTDTIKKYEKENGELGKLVEVKNGMLDKLRNEITELSLIINQDKYKSIRTMDNELKKQTQLAKQLAADRDAKQRENEALTRELDQFRTVLERLTVEYERCQSRQTETSFRDDKADRVRQLEEELKIKVNTINEFKTVTEKLTEEMDYFRELCVKQKEKCNKLDDNVEFYRGLLMKHNIKLS